MTNNPPDAAQRPEELMKKPVSGIDELPAYSYALAAAPSVSLTGPVELLLELAEAIVADDAKTLAEYDIKDRATHERFLNNRIALAMLRKDIAGVRRLTAELRAIQERPDARMTAGLINEIVAEAQQHARPSEAVIDIARERLDTLNHAEHAAWLRQQNISLAMITPEFLIGSAKQHYDPLAAVNGGRIGQSEAASLVGARVMLDQLIPLAEEITIILRSLIEKHPEETTGIDIWPQRTVILTEASAAFPVTIAIWDAGVDLDLFAVADDPGFGIDWEGRPMTSTLRPCSAYEGRIGELLEFVKGSTDLQAGQMTPEAERFHAAFRSLKPEEVEDFSDAIGFITSYAHGTASASVAVASNPFARVQAVSVVLPSTRHEMKLDREVSKRRAAFYLYAVRRMQRSGVRVVNMSWALTPMMMEAFLRVQGDLPDAERRRAVASELFGIEKAALDAAIKSAPELLFVAAAGNDASDAGFAQIIPSGLSAPNLLTVGAVDRSGREALFTSVGGTVAIHANGVAVDAILPGGRHVKSSGTSMASPQVANAAAKLFAVKPELTAIEIRELLINTADRSERVNLLNMRAAFRKVGAEL